MMKMIRKLANATSRPKAKWYTETHTRIDKWGRATKEWAQNVESTENARVAQLKRDASTIAQ